MTRNGKIYSYHYELEDFILEYSHFFNKNEIEIRKLIEINGIKHLSPKLCIPYFDFIKMPKEQLYNKIKTYLLMS